ncbi:MAG TPA: TIGR03620 family F420-dependent LLM class oxidoreductase [Acidimicrobiia bacterium]|nr:TIGR03620 family F420-dependent LLM class oxidoreductase [Acidimicrobiia bacterium]
MDLHAPLPPLGTVGVFSWGVVTRPVAEVRSAAKAIEDMGYGAIWFPESRGREALTAASLVLEATETIVVATGIASIWARDAMAAALGAYGLAEAHPGRFVLGLGVSHAPSVARRGHDYDNPLARMTAYLDALEAASNPLDGDDPPVVLAALGPQMLSLAAERTSGAHPYFVPVSHTAFARERVGPGRLVAPEQAVVIDPDPSSARATARGHMERYLLLDNYRRNLLRLGWQESDVDDGGSDALVDAVVGWGDADTVAARIREHLDAGADHVSIQPLGDPWGLDQLDAMAGLLL